ncbi:hypothetical protein [Pseudonocardia sp. C8]|nr:hypothetical protein [Pseudonocardia sp. C8]
MNPSSTPGLPAPIQGTDSIITDKATAELWPLIADSMQLVNWARR